jgi:hypothetical protein
VKITLRPLVPEEVLSPFGKVNAALVVVGSNLFTQFGTPFQNRIVTFSGFCSHNRDNIQRCRISSCLDEREWHLFQLFSTQFDGKGHTALMLASMYGHLDEMCCTIR